MYNWFTKILLVLVLLSGSHNGIGQNVGIGEWDSYFTLKNMLDVEEGDNKIVWVSDLSALYYDMEDNSINQLNKIHGLTQTGFTKVCYNAAHKTFVLAYNDGNLDLVTFDQNNKPLTVNMSDIKRSSLTGDKTIYGLYSYNSNVYVSCGFGMVVLDLSKQEVKDTYIIGASSSQIKINGVCVGQDTIYAATDNGIYKAYVNNPFLNYFASWSKMTSLPSHLISKPFKTPSFVNNKLFIIPDNAGFGQDTAYYREGAVWSICPILQGTDFVEVKSLANGNMFFSTVQNTSVVTPTFGYIDEVFQYSGVSGLSVNDAVYSLADNNYYIADMNKGPYQCKNSYYAVSFLPGGTKTSSIRRITIDQGQLWVAPGGVGGTIFSNQYNTDFFSVKEGNDWTYMDISTDPLLANNVYDVLDVDVDPLDPTHVFAAVWSLHGLVEIKDKKVIALYDETNSPLYSPVGNPNFCGVASVKFDDEGNLWLLNGLSSSPLMVKTTDGQWKSFYCGSEFASRTYYDLIIDENTGYKYWSIPTQGTAAGGVTIYNDNGTITDATDDQYYNYKTLSGLGNLPDADVKCVAIDKDGELWIGTSKGPAVVYNPANAFSGGNADAQRILIQQDGNTQILLETEIINCIYVDEANKKWIGTDKSGVYLLSDDGQEQVYHFTVENSPLPSNAIFDIDIDGKTGEVFFATSNGLISFRGLATESNANFDNTKVFPNPVRPDYDGPIAINGLSRNTDVKVTDIAGNVITVVKSEGGQAVWDGKNVNGQKVKTGIYLFMCASEDGSDKVAGKVLFVE